MQPFWIPAPALLGFSLRRALGGAFVAWCAAVGAMLALREFAPPTAWLGARSADETGAIVSGLARQGVWSGVFVAIVPFLILRAARTVGVWRTGEVDWLASRAASRSTILVWTWLGYLSAALLVLAATCVLAEARAGRGMPSLRLVGRIGEAGSDWIVGRQALVWRAADPGDLAPPGSRARFELALGSSTGPGAEVILSARREAQAESKLTSKRPESRIATRIGTRSEIEIELPSGVGDIQLALACAEDGDRAFLLSKTGELWAPASSDREASLAIFARAAVALAAWLALVLGFGAWLHATSAMGLLLSLMLPVWMVLAPSSILPGGDLFSALAIIGRGRVPPAIDARSFVVAAILVVCGLGVARWSLASWRRGS